MGNLWRRWAICNLKILLRCTPRGGGPECSLDSTCLWETISHSSLAPGSCYLLCPRSWEMGVPGPETPAKYRDGEFLALRLEPHPRCPKLECLKKTYFKDSVTQGLIFLQCTQLGTSGATWVSGLLSEPKIPHSLVSIGKHYASSKQMTRKQREHGLYRTGMLVLKEQHKHFPACVETSEQKVGRFLRSVQSEQDCHFRRSMIPF